MSELIQTSAQNGTTYITLHRSEKGNSLSEEMVNALSAAVQRSYDDDTSLMVLEAEGQNFCTGFDLENVLEETDDSLMARFIRIELLLQKLHSAPFITVAMGGGLHVGAGADLFAACRYRVVTRDARFRFPGAAFGLILGTGRLTRLVGATRAGRWVGSGCWVEQDEAATAGLVTHVTSADHIEKLLADFTQESARLDRQTRYAIYSASGSHNEEDLAALVRSAASPGLKERIQSYRSKVLKRKAATA